MLSVDRRERALLIFITNTPRTYAWGSAEALPELLGSNATGEPQAELWLGAHPSAPAEVAKANGEQELDLIDLIASDSERYGVDGGQLPFLLKVLAIGAPLSLQVHPNKAQAEVGFAAEEEAGVSSSDPTRNYGDPNHKPELLVALSEVTALSGFRPIGDARDDLRVLAELAEVRGAPEAAVRGLRHAASLCDVLGEGDAARAARTEFLRWALAGGEDAVAASSAIAELFASFNADERSSELAGEADFAAGSLGLEEVRVWSLARLTETYPGDTGVLISLLLHVVRLQPGEAIYLGAQQLHAYLDGLAVEIMAASDNVLRAGFTPKHIDVAEVMNIVDPGALDTPLIGATEVRPGLLRWQPDVPDFSLMRVRVKEQAGDEAFADIARDGENGSESVGANDGVSGGELQGAAESVRVEAPHPLVMIVTQGRVRIDRDEMGLAEFAVAKRGQSLYVSAGEPIELSGAGEMFIATVGDTWPRVSQPSSPG